MEMAQFCNHMYLKNDVCFNPRRHTQDSKAAVYPCFGGCLSIRLLTKTTAVGIYSVNQSVKLIFYKSNQIFYLLVLYWEKQIQYDFIYTYILLQIKSKMFKQVFHSIWSCIFYLNNTFCLLLLIKPAQTYILIYPVALL